MPLSASKRDTSVMVFMPLDSAKPATCCTTAWQKKPMIASTLRMPLLLRLLRVPSLHEGCKTLISRFSRSLGTERFLPGVSDPLIASPTPPRPGIQLRIACFTCRSAIVPVISGRHKSPPRKLLAISFSFSLPV